MNILKKILTFKQNNKTNFYLLLLLILLALAWPTSIIWRFMTSKSYEQSAQYFREIYEQIKNEVFYTAELEDNNIILYNEDDCELKRILLTTTNKKRDLLIISRDSETNQIYFILGGSVDDNYGILFTDDSSVNMDGLHNIERIGGNSFYYSTMYNF